MRGFFSRKKQKVLLSLDGQSDYKSAISLDGPIRYSVAPHRATVAHVYAGATSDEIVVVTSISEDGSNLLFDDKIDLGAVGQPLHSWRAASAYPTRPMILPADRLRALVLNQLDATEAQEAYERALERAESAPSPAP